MLKTTLSLRRQRLALTAAILAAGAVGTQELLATSATPAIDSVTVSRPFFDPTQGQAITVSFVLGEDGSLDVVVLDRDGFAVRTLARSKAARAGKQSYEWNGRDDSGVVVPDEAYSLKIDLASKAGAYQYCPATAPVRDVKATPGYYDRGTATFSYRLDEPARVHLQAGISRTNPKTGEKSGPVLKTLVNREPRPGGAVVETWNGFDETKSYSVAELPDFVLSIAATSLPENPIIAVGNRTTTYLESISARSGLPLVSLATAEHLHHRGLTAANDVSPLLAAVPSNANHSSKDRLWHIEGASLKGSLRLEGPSATSFARQPAKLVIFIDCEPVEIRRSPATGMGFDIPLTKVKPGDHIVAFDWVSEYGPLAATSLKVHVDGNRAGATGGR